MMNGWYHDMGAGDWIFMAIFWVAVLVAFAWLLTSLLGGKGQSSESRERPQEILDRRLAAGEIDARTYDELSAKLRAFADKKS
jgi:putative membrane protein